MSIDPDYLNQIATELEHLTGVLAELEPDAAPGVETRISRAMMHIRATRGLIQEHLFVHFRTGPMEWGRIAPRGIVISPFAKPECPHPMPCPDDCATCTHERV